MIKTKKVHLTAKELFSILIIRYLKKRWWLFAWIWLPAAFFLFDGIYESIDIFSIAFAVIYPFIIVIQFWVHVTSKDNKVLLLERYYEIDSDKINGIIDQDTCSLIKIEHFIKVELVRKTYLLYISKNQFVYIPVNAFKTDLDKEWFEREIVKRIKK